jgi:hypothetical protein
MKNIFKSFIILGTVMLTFSSCDDSLLDIDAKAVISKDEIAANPDLAEKLFLASYSDLQAHIPNLGTPAPSYTGWAAYCDEGRDNAPVWDGANGFTNPNGDGYGSAFKRSEKDGYFWVYKEIKKLNKYIAEFGGETDPQILSTVGEAYFVRAYFYFEMAKRFGGIPIIATLADNDVEVLRRESELDTWEFIAADLDMAIGYLVESYTDAVMDKDRANKYTACALKARAMLFAGSVAKYGKEPFNNDLQGLPSAKAVDYFKQAYDAAKIIKDDAKYGLHADYQNIFLEENNDEVIFQFNFDYPGNGHSYDMHWAPYRFRDGWGTETVPVVEMVESYEKLDGTPFVLDYNAEYQSVSELFEGLDKRFDATILRGGSKWMGETMEMYRSTTVINEDDSENEYYINSEGGFGTEDNIVPGTDGVRATGLDGPINVQGGWDISRTGFYIKKYLDPDNILPSDQSWQNQVLFRYGDVLLMLAEAGAELGGEYVAAGQIAMNEVRERAGLSAKALSVDAVRQERKIEMAFEDNRFWDLRRWRIGTEVLNSRMFHALNPIQVIDRSETPTRTYFKIEKVEPGSHLKPKLYNEKDNYCPLDLGANPGMIQNEGW